MPWCPTTVFSSVTVAQGYEIICAMKVNAELFNVHIISFTVLDDDIALYSSIILLLVCLPNLAEIVFCNTM